MPKGGARPGSGRPKGSTGPHKATISKELAREALRQVVMAHLDEMVSAQVAHAKGLKYLVTRDAKTGKFTRVSREMMDKLLEAGDEDALARVEVWEKEPSVQAFTDLLNRALDKPKEQEQEIRHAGGLVIQHETID